MDLIYRAVSEVRQRPAALPTHPGVGRQGEELGHQEASPLDGEVVGEGLDVLEGTGCNISGAERKLG